VNTGKGTNEAGVTFTKRRSREENLKKVKKNLFCDQKEKSEEEGGTAGGEQNASTPSGKKRHV